MQVDGLDIGPWQWRIACVKVRAVYILALLSSFCSEARASAMIGCGALSLVWAAPGRAGEELTCMCGDGAIWDDLPHSAALL